MTGSDASVATLSAPRRLRSALCALGVVMALGAWMAPVRAQAPVSVQAEVEPRRVPLDGTVRLTVTVRGRDVGDVSPPSLQALEDFSVLQGPSVSTQFSYVNGVSSAARSFSWVLGPTQKGTQRIPPLILQVGGQTLKTRALEVQVEDAGPAQPGPGRPPAAPSDAGAPRDRGGDLFIRAQLEPADPYVGQPAILSYQLYTREEVTQIPQLQEVPSYPGFRFEELENPDRITPRPEEIDGREYRVYTVRRVALFPTTSGETTLPPATFAVTVRSRESAPRRRSFFFDSVETVYRRTLPVPVRVRPLPEAGRPDGFSNAVGRYEMEVTVDRAEARTGEAIGMRVALSGSGNLRSLSAPQLEPSSDFTIYPPQPVDNGPTAADPLSGTQAWEYILLPQVPGSQALPRAGFSYFDPEAEEYRILVAPPIEVAVTGPALTAAAATGPERREIRRLGHDIHHIKVGAWTARAPAPPLYRSSWFWFWLAAPPLLNVGALAWRWQRRRAEARAAVIRRRRARRTALRRLQRAGSLSEGRDRRAFFREVAQALTEYVADKFGTVATGLTYDRIASLLATASVPEAASRSFLGVLEECDCARFAPAGDQARALGEVLQRARAAVAELEAHL